MNAVMVQYAAAKGVPMPEAAVAVAGVLILVGGLCVLTGFQPYVGLSCIALFRVRHADDAQLLGADGPDGAYERDGTLPQQCGAAGGTFVMFAVPRPWPYSVELQRRIRA